MLLLTLNVGWALVNHTAYSARHEDGLGVYECVLRNSKAKENTGRSTNPVKLGVGEVQNR